MEHKDPDTYVKIKNVDKYENLEAFNFTGYGWTVRDKLNSKCGNIDVALEDDLLGARGYLIDKDDIEICENQKSF